MYLHIVRLSEKCINELRISEVLKERDVNLSGFLIKGFVAPVGMEAGEGGRNSVVIPQEHRHHQSERWMNVTTCVTKFHSKGKKGRLAFYRSE
jgi:hypothetical protein